MCGCSDAAALVGRSSIGQRRVRDRVAFDQRHSSDFFVISAIQTDHHPGTGAAVLGGGQSLDSETTVSLCRVTNMRPQLGWALSSIRYPTRLSGASSPAWAGETRDVGHEFQLSPMAKSDWWVMWSSRAPVRRSALIDIHFLRAADDLLAGGNSHCSRCEFAPRSPWVTRKRRSRLWRDRVERHQTST